MSDNKALREFIEDYGSNIIPAVGVAIVVGVGVYVNRDTLFQRFANYNQVQAVAASASHRTAVLEQLQKEAEASAAIAEQRYAAGCTKIVATRDRTKFAVIQEGFPVLDSATGGTVPAGAVICDPTGNTAVLKDIDGDGIAEATALAYTGKKEAILNVYSQGEIDFFNQTTRPEQSAELTDSVPAMW
ncbi:MAG: hypothetical protein J7642_21235 [Cyanobacteria bacterium SBC]|nr:hypothetical protein [Cyanobacteria bacterium SBC]